MTAIRKGAGPTTDRASQPGETNCPGGPLAAINGDEAPVCHFRLAPPRHFAYPALLLLLAEEPRHGYCLVDGLRHLGFGPVSRPSVYRALADLEHDGLLESWSAEPTAGSTRHMYGLTESGREQLDAWMDVVARERDGLDRVVDRFVRWRGDPSKDEVDTG